MLIQIFATGTRGPNGKGSEVWMFAPRNGDGTPQLKDLRMAGGKDWVIKQETTSGLGAALVAHNATTLAFEATAETVRMRFLRHPWSGVVTITAGDLARDFVLSSEHTEAEPFEVICTSSAIQTSHEFDRHQLDTLADDAVVAIAAPRWRGVYNATAKVVDHVVAAPRDPGVAPPDMSRTEFEDLVNRIVLAKPRDWIVSGGDLIFIDVVRAVRIRAPEKRFHLLYHGAFFALGMGLDRSILMSWVEAARAGDIAGIVTVKRGLDRLCRSLEVPASFLPLDYIPPTRTATSIERTAGNRRLGIWLSRSDDPRKACPALPYAIAGMADIELHAAGLEWPVVRIFAELGVPISFHSPEPIPTATLHRKLAEMDVNLYLTASECSPMLPLESLAAGTPCLIGPVTYYFADNPYLRDRLVVPNLAHAGDIRRRINRVLDERDQIMAAYADYASKERPSSKELLQKFVSAAATS